MANDLKAALERILEEPGNTLSDGKALKAIVRIAKDALAREANASLSTSKQAGAEPVADARTLKTHARNLRSDSVAVKQVYDHLQAMAEEIEILAYATPPAVMPAAPSDSEWKCGNEFAPYNPQASHINPDHRDGWNACYRAAQASLLAKEAECEALRKDAARYRWLREEAQYFPSGRAPAVVLCDEHDLLEKGRTQGDWGFISDGKLDAAIDAARAAADQGGAS